MPMISDSTLMLRLQVAHNQDFFWKVGGSCLVLEYHGYNLIELFNDVWSVPCLLQILLPW